MSLTSFLKDNADVREHFRVRHSMSISEADLACKRKVSRSMICDIEKGRVLVSPALAMKIARIGKFPEDMAIKYCLEDQLKKAEI